MTNLMKFWCSFAISMGRTGFVLEVIGKRIKEIVWIGNYFVRRI